MDRRHAERTRGLAEDLQLKTKRREGPTVTRYDGIWIQRGERLVRSHEGDHGLIDEEFANDYERLYGQGHLVLLVPGKNHSLDELFFFETAADARQFYEGDLGEFECF